MIQQSAPSLTTLLLCTGTGTHHGCIYRYDGGCPAFGSDASKPVGSWGLEPEDTTWGTAPGAAAPLRSVHVVVPDPSMEVAILRTADQPSRNARVEAERELFGALLYERGVIFSQIFLPLIF